MFHTWLELPVAGVFASLALLYYGGAVILFWLTCKSGLGSRIRSLNGVVAPFFSAIAVLFALLTGFLAIDVGDRSKQAHAQVRAEATALHNLHTLSVVSVSDMRAIRKAIRAYVVAATTDEWTGMPYGRPSPATNAAYDDMLHEVSTPSISRDASEPVHQAMLRAAIEVGAARNARLSLASDRTNHLKWISVILLGLITQVAIALVHVTQEGRAFLAAQIVFASAVVVALGIIALQETPFSGAFSVQPTLLEQIKVLPIEVTPVAAAE
jgi:hypothetical protein